MNKANMKNIGDHQEAAHAASELDDFKPSPFWWLDDLLWSVGLTAVVLFFLAVAGVFV